MRHSLYTCILLFSTLAVFLSNCQTNSSISESMELADSLMLHSPDSSIAIMFSIDTSTLKDRQERARYALLMTMALDKNYLIPQDSSLISYAVNYYTQNYQNPELIKALYYKGRVFFLHQNYPKAMENFLIALDIAQNNKENFWVGMSCRGIADIYSETSNFIPQLEYASKEFQYFTISRTQPYINYALADLARATHNNRLYHRTDSLLTLLLDSAYKYNDSFLNYYALHLRASGLVSRKRYGEALSILNHICNSSFAETTDSLKLSLSLLKVGNLSDSQRILDLISNNEPDLKRVLNFHILESTKEYEKAIEESLAIYHSVESLMQSDINNRIDSVVSKHKMNSFESFKNINKRNSLWFKIIIAFLAVCSLCLFLYYTYIINLKNNKISTLNDYAKKLIQQISTETGNINREPEASNQDSEVLNPDLENMNQESEALNQEHEFVNQEVESVNQVPDAINQTPEDDSKNSGEIINDSKEDTENINYTIKNNDYSYPGNNLTSNQINDTTKTNKSFAEIARYILSSKYSLLDELVEIMYVNKDSTSTRRKIADKVSNIISALSERSSRIIEMEDDIDNLHNNLMSDFKTDLPNLKELDYRLFLFLVHKFPLPTIAFLLSEGNIDMVYSRKKRLKKKITGLSSINRDRYLYYF